MMKPDLPTLRLANTNAQETKLWGTNWLFFGSSCPSWCRLPSDSMQWLKASQATLLCLLAIFVALIGNLCCSEWGKYQRQQTIDAQYEYVTRQVYLMHRAHLLEEVNRWKTSRFEPTGATTQKKPSSTDASF